MSKNAGPTRFGKYILLEQIGKGGMAEVRLARLLQQKRLVAIKIMHEQLAKQKRFVEMFIQEGKLAVQLNHDAIVKTYEIGRIHGRHFICMEYISGVDLAHVLRVCRANSDRRLPVPHALYIAARICEGLHFAHELRDSKGVLLNVVNRDVSPPNIRISFDGEIKLLDFGIAKNVSNLSSEIGVLKGKISYMSPEQVRGQPLDRRSDVFAAGIVIHEILTQEKLIRGDSEAQLMNKVLQADVPPPSSVNSRIPPEVDQIVLKAVEKKADDRFQTAEEMARQLREVLARYNFRKVELRDLVRKISHKEWTEEEQRIATALDQETPASASPEDSDESYGVMIEVVDTSETPSQSPAPAAAPMPRWMWGLLALAVVLLLVAVVLLFTS